MKVEKSNHENQMLRRYAFKVSMHSSYKLRSDSVFKWFANFASGTPQGTAKNLRLSDQEHVTPFLISFLSFFSFFFLLDHNIQNKKKYFDGSGQHLCTTPQT